MSDALLILLLSTSIELQIYCREWRLFLLTQPNWCRFTELICYLLWVGRSNIPFFTARESSVGTEALGVVVLVHSVLGVGRRQDAGSLRDCCASLWNCTWCILVLFFREWQSLRWVQWGRGGISGLSLLLVKCGRSWCSPGTINAVSSLWYPLERTCLLLTHPQLRMGLPCGLWLTAVNTTIQEGVLH